MQPVPDDMKHIKPLYAPDHDPLWAVCEELGVVVNTHSGGAGMPDYGPYEAAGILWIAETTFFSRRPLTQMLVGGVFERFPRSSASCSPSREHLGSVPCWPSSIRITAK